MPVPIVSEKVVVPLTKTVPAPLIAAACVTAPLVVNVAPTTGCLVIVVEETVCDALTV